MMPALHILVAEDNEDDLFLLQQAFRKSQAPAELHGVADGMDAIAYLSGLDPFADRTCHPFPDIMLLDINMPRMNGFEVLEWIRNDSRCSRLIVHMLTASSRPADVQRAYELHANGYLVKPSRLDELVALTAALWNWHRFVSLSSPENNETADQRRDAAVFRS